MSVKTKIISITGASVVALGAFGAHGLKPLLDSTQLETFKTATLYHFIHVLAMWLCFTFAKDSKIASISFYLFFAGILCFSGSLYLLSTQHLYAGDTLNFLGPITPIGGLLFVAGWLNLWRLKI